MNLKEIRETAATLAKVGITSKEKLSEALPTLCEGLQRVKDMRSAITSTAEALKELGDKCAMYALAHETVFDDGKPLCGQDGVMKGDITFDGVTYHLAAGYGKPVRIDGEFMKQEFLEELPKGWTKAKLEIDTTGLKRLGITVDQLQDEGLMRPANNVWSVKHDTYWSGGEV